MLDGHFANTINAAAINFIEAQRHVRALPEGSTEAAERAAKVRRENAYAKLKGLVR